MARNTWLFKISLKWSLGLFAVASEAVICPVPVASAANPTNCYSLINSVDFHPTRNLFCITCTHGNEIILYEIDEEGSPRIVQRINNPSAQLSEPQHAVFSPDGEKIVVVNWTNQTLAIYPCEENGFYRTAPIAVIPHPARLPHHKPHGMAFSPSGHFLAIAYGAANYHGRAIALFKECELVSVLEEELPGIPKGITFSPDGASLLVTFADQNSLVIFDLVDGTICPIPKQIIQGPETLISRPEDVKISPDGALCAVSNSDQHTISFYSFDKVLNRVAQTTPCFILQNPEAGFCFPHGIAFSPDGSFLLITEFGPIRTTNEGDITWDPSMKPDLAKISIYRKLSSDL
jgi:DNA-binding beta-propeller fold protein YncE